ncbi:MAG: hypothetical protein RLZZ436_1221 [Planctomycetota bacterium]
MSTIILFVCGCILCLIFLGALYADHVHVGFLFEGRWLGPLFGVLARFWMSVAESFVLAFSLGFSQLTWVMAAISGGLGLLLILFMLGGGIAADASLWHKDQQAPLFSGGVLDRIPSLAVAAEPQLTTVARLERDDSDLFSTSGGRYLVFDVPDAVPALPRPRARLPLEGVIRDVPDVGFGPGALQPRLLMEFRRRGTQLSDSERYGEQRTPGMLLDDLPESSVIERALRLLSFDGWRASLYGGSELERLVPVEESTAAELRDLERGVRVYAGGAVASSDIEIDKRAPELSEDGLVSVELELRNAGRETIDGLLVRERLPRGTLLLSSDPPAVWREDELVWRLDDLRSDEQRVLRFSVQPDQALPMDAVSGDDTVFVTETIVSALLAVTSPTDVTGDGLQPARGYPGRGEFEGSELGLPELEDMRSDRRRLLPDVSTLELSEGLNVVLRVEKESEVAVVGAWTRVYFDVENRGDAELSGIQLRVMLDEFLEHPRLSADAVERSIVAEVPQLRRGETRQVVLTVRPLKAGEFRCTAEVLSSGIQAGVENFEVIAR